MKDDQIAALQAIVNEQRSMYERSIDELVGTHRPSSGSGASGAVHLRSSRSAARNRLQPVSSRSSATLSTARQTIGSRPPLVEVEEEYAYDQDRSPASQYNPRSGQVSYGISDAEWDER